MLGYPLAGDLSLGGYRSENFIFGKHLSEEAAVQAWQGDDPHLNTMLSPNRNDIGAGVAFGADGEVYLVVETALSTSSRQPQSDAELYLPGGSGEGANPELALSQYIVPIKVAAARPDGNVFHTVQYGQSLWAIAIAYGTRIESIRALNNLTGTTVWPNQYLLVMQGATQPAPPPTILPEIGTVDPAASSTGQAAVLDMPTPTLWAVEEAAQPEPRGLPMFAWVAVIVVLLLIGAVSAAWFIRDPGGGRGG
jgi:LysM repeat protein